MKKRVLQLGGKNKKEQHKLQENNKSTSMFPEHITKNTKMIQNNFQSAKLLVQIKQIC